MVAAEVQGPLATVAVAGASEAFAPQGVGVQVRLLNPCDPGPFLRERMGTLAGCLI
jgi:hypothetical protein